MAHLPLGVDEILRGASMECISLKLASATRGWCLQCRLYTAFRSDICQSGNNSQLGAVSSSMLDRKGSDIGAVHQGLSAMQ